MSSISPKIACLITAIAATAIPNLAAANVFPEGYFKLTTQFREGHNECLEGNAKDRGHGSAYMDSCQNVSGQLWKATPAGNGYFKLTTQWRESQNECLESGVNGADVRNRVGSYMHACKNESGQLWKATPASNGYFKLTSQFREKENECLEGNQKAGSKNGVTFMDSCQNVSGQLWKIKTTAAASARDPFYGTWTGQGYQSDTKTNWSIKMTLAENTSSIEYPSLGCSGTLKLLSKTADKIVFKETLTKNPENVCTNNGTVELKLKNGQLQYEYARSDGVKNAKSILTKK